MVPLPAGHVPQPAVLPPLRPVPPVPLPTEGLPSEQLPHPPRGEPAPGRQKSRNLSSVLPPILGFGLERSLIMAKV